MATDSTLAARLEEQDIRAGNVQKFTVIGTSPILNKIQIEGMLATMFSLRHLRARQRGQDMLSLREADFGIPRVCLIVFFFQ